MRSSMHAAALVPALALLVFSAAAQTPGPPQALGALGKRGVPVFTPLVLEGDLVGVSTVNTISNFAVNDSGSWIVEAATNAPSDVNDVLVQDGFLLLIEGQVLLEPLGATIDTFDTVNLSNTGHSGWNFFLDGTSGSSDDSGLYWDTDLLIQEGDVSTASGFSAGTPYRGFFEAKIDSSDNILYIATVDDPAISSSVDQALLLAATDGSGNLTSETLLAFEGDVLSGQSEAIATFGTSSHNFSLNEAGDTMFVADLAGSTATDVVVYLNSTLIAQEGSSAPIPERNWDLGTSSTALNLNDACSYALKGTLDGDTSSNTLIVVDGEKLVQEGDTLPAIAPYSFTSFGSGPVLLDDRGTVLWYGEWDDPDTDVNSALFVNHRILVQEGVTRLEGELVDTLRGITDGYTMSPSGRYVVFEAVLADGTEGAWRVRRDLFPRGPSGAEAAGAASSERWLLDAGPSNAGRLFVLVVGPTGTDDAPASRVEHVGLLDGAGRASVEVSGAAGLALERFFLVLDASGLPTFVSPRVAGG